ncbi:MBL fold metallo-hydrolase [Thalassobacillus hwangdonensis]|uniref:MBL fold metallo-hydrolase n=1 Tax=Thalassobacillus hwangdonensis TaxID=546108 RepID=A0ABW3L069_9BACI
MKVIQMPLGPLGTNAYIIREGKECLIVDPGGEGEKLITYLNEEALKPVAALLTHAHFDHIGAVDKVRDHFKIPVYLHKEEKDWLMDPTKNGSSFFQMGEITAEDPDHLLTPGPLTVGPFKMEVRHTPGHSPGSVSFIFDTFAVSGDALFQRGIGRTDLPGGDMQTLLTSIRTELFSLGDAYVVYPGHGPATTIGEEKSENPFLT